MEEIRVEKSYSTPEIKTDSKAGTLSISGKSYPENTLDFYQPMLLWLKSYLKSKPEQLTVNFEIVYFNSSSLKIFYDIFDILEEKNRNGQKLLVNWRYFPENENAAEIGENFREDFESLEINLIVLDQS